LILHILQWKEGAKDGKGTYFFIDGGRYDGDWVGDYKNGNG